VRDERLKWAGGVVRLSHNRIPEQIVGGYLGGRRPAGRLRTDEKTRCGKVLPDCSIPETGEQRQDRGMIEGGKQRKPWPGNRPKSHRKKKKKMRRRRRRRKRKGTKKRRTVSRSADWILWSVVFILKFLSHARYMFHSGNKYGS
jgi:hypothetical protein